ncbi:putative krueppel c2h2-type zinc finger protein [Danaus plexippus plexippus]|uniref:Krueppel c2h2-type zinc finger protein n=1 Tax=Danaus plexippus plexippus TaxID=278856 RepID=A0A212FK79_DANPL|nr:putative krueppel c2h2-type zinc finger protein [Danaus plexippus plexippus]
MDNVCRLCCSAKFVNNYIFDEGNALYLKMSLYLPIKVFKNDRLPQKICDKCSCKVNDFYQFCNETIEVQNRLRGLLRQTILDDNTVDFSIKENIHSPSRLAICERSTQTNFNDTFQVKTEPRSETPLIVKEESCDEDLNNVASDASEDELLIEIKKKKKPRKVNSNVNEKKDNKRNRKRKERQDWPDDGFDNGLDLGVVKEEVDLVKQEASDYTCCMCFEKCSNKTEMLQHYKNHGDSAAAPQTAPPPPQGDVQRCLRCQKVVSGGLAEWSEHWKRHYARDTRPYRCVLCARTFRDHHLILKHGLTHQADIEDKSLAPGGGVLPDKRFVCDVCPEGFPYLRCLLAHRTRAHPEALNRAARLRCGVCARGFAHCNSLRRHLRAHSGERNFLCNVCGKALTSREHLKFHIRIHTGYKPNVCKVCGKGFVKKCNLTLHERVHSGEKPHVCPHCGKAFSQRSTLVIHERYHSGARPYTCGLCGRGFVAKGLLSMHLKSTCVDTTQARSQQKLNSR